MFARRLGTAVLLLALGNLTGCASWCARNYPCGTPAACAAPVCCCPAPAAAAPVCQPAGYAPTWQQPAAAPCTCR
jgi:hypothetical protein